ncbi:MAG: methyltransferase domain-containing protein [bacterium]|nr:methyltransferase domain-containing protein [bacterium]
MKIKKRGQRFSKEIFTDEQSSFISNPEYVAEHVVETIVGLGDFKSAVELCCCIGITCIQLAKRLSNVVGVDSNNSRIEMARKNAVLYGVSGKTKFIVGDVLDIELLKSIKADVAVLDPGWATRLMDRSSHVSDVNLTQPSLKKMFDLTSQYVTKNIVARVPATFTRNTLKELGYCKIENIIINNEIVFKVCYFIGGIEKFNEVDIVFG